MASIGLETDDIHVDEGISEHIIEALRFDNIVPSKGLFLGLDISKNSTGITYIENGERVTGNIILEDEKGVHKEVLLRRALKRDLLELVAGKEFDLIIVEDAFVGENAETVRTLFALNTAIDELILDGECSCKKFLRVSNKTWKSWLGVVDTAGVAKGLNDKEKIRIWLEMVGITDDGEGYQDRLDSTGMIVGYFLKGISGGKGDTSKKRKKVSINDVEGSYEIDTSYLFYGRDDIDKDNVKFLDYSRISKKRVLELLTENPEAVYVLEEKVRIGNLGIDLGLDIIDEGGYFAFWVNPKKRKKYIIKEEKDGECV